MTYKLKNKKHTTYRAYGPSWNYDQPKWFSESKLQERLTYYNWRLDFKPRRYIDVPTPRGFRTICRGYPVYGPITITVPVSGGNYEDETQAVWLFWNIDANCKGFWALMDNGSLYHWSDKKIEVVLMFTNRNDALMAKLGGLHKPIK